MGKFSIRINPRYQKLYIVIAFFGIMLVAGLTAGFMTGKLVNPFSQAGSVNPICWRQITKPRQITETITRDEEITANQKCNTNYFTYKNKHPDKCIDTKQVTNPGFGDPEMKTCSCTYTITKSVNTSYCSEIRCKKAGYHPSSSEAWLDEINKITCIKNELPQPQCNTITEDHGIKIFSTRSCPSGYTKVKTCYDGNNEKLVCKTTATVNPTTNPTTTDNVAIEKCERQGGTWKDGKCVLPSQSSYSPQCNEIQGGTGIFTQSGACPSNSTDIGDCYNGSTKLNVCKTTSTQDDNNTPATEDTGETNTSTTTSDDSCDPTYKIPLKITGVSVDYHTCSNDVYTVKYTIKIHADNADKKECGGGHFSLSAIFPSTVQFDAGATQTSSPSAKPVDNKVNWNDRSVYDNSDQTYTLTAKIPKSQLTKETLTTTFKITLGDHTSDGGKLQTASSSNVGDCYTTGTTDAGGDDTSDDNNTGDDTNTTDDTTNTGDTTAGGDGTDPAYVPPSTGIIDEHPVFFISALAILAIIEHTFGIFTNLLIKLKKYVD